MYMKKQKQNKQTHIHIMYFVLNQILPYLSEGAMHTFRPPRDVSILYIHACRVSKIPN